MKILSIGSVCLLAAFVVGCGETRDASTEKPVTMQAGNYNITFTGAGMAGMIQRMVQSGPGNSSSDVCVGADEIDSFPTNIAQNSFSMEGNCDLIESDRTGNHISGVYSCPMDPKMSAGEFVVKYTGTIDETAINFKYSMNFDTEAKAELTPETAKIAKAIKKLDLRVKVKRKGKCSDSAAQNSDDDSYESDSYEDDGYGDDSY